MAAPSGSAEGSWFSRWKRRRARHACRRLRSGVEGTPAALAAPIALSYDDPPSHVYPLDARNDENYILLYVSQVYIKILYFFSALLACGRPMLFFPIERFVAASTYNIYNIGNLDDGSK